MAARVSRDFRRVRGRNGTWRRVARSRSFVDHALGFEWAVDSPLISLGRTHVAWLGVPVSAPAQLAAASGHGADCGGTAGSAQRASSPLDRQLAHRSAAGPALGASRAGGGDYTRDTLGRAFALGSTSPG